MKICVYLRNYNRITKICILNYFEIKSRKCNSVTVVQKFYQRDCLEFSSIDAQIEGEQFKKRVKESFVCLNQQLKRVEEA